eukprot:gene22710-29866_t
MTSPFKRDALYGKVALITGGSSGIGMEIARQLGLHGASVFITGRREDVLAAACKAMQVEGISCVALQGDVRQQESGDRWMEAVKKQFGKLDILVNCAAGNFLAAAEELSQNGFKTVMEIDAVGTFTMSRAAYSNLCKGDNPVIINISATLQYGATWFQVHASAAKAAVDSITRSLALEWGSSGIRINGIAPGPIEGTAGMSKLAPGSEEKMMKMVTETIPLGRMGRKWDIAMAAVFLASPAASFMTGDTMVVDGAAWMWKPSPIPRSAVSKVSRGVESTSRTVGTAAPKIPSKL